MKAGLLLQTRVATALVVLLAIGLRGRTAAALTPESPQVKAAIASAVKFLESDAATDGRVGAKALVGLVMLKNHANPKHPRIVEAVQAIQHVVQGVEPAKISIDDEHEIYSAGLSIIFLATLDARTYSNEIGYLLQFLKARQKPHGGWGYPNQDSGDTSMTQYGVLSAWEAKQAGCNVSRDTVEKVTVWLLKTQDPTGAYGYQGIVSPVDALVKQNDIRPSMVVGGVGSVYMCADLLDLVPRAAKRDENLPAALVEVEADRPAPPRPTSPRPTSRRPSIRAASRRPRPAATPTWQDTIR